MGLFRKKDKSIKVDVNIDYEKLAEAIVKAQREAARQNKRPNRFRGSLMGSLNAGLYLLITMFSVVMIIGAWLTYDALIKQLFYTFFFGVIALVSVGSVVESLKDNDENAHQHFNTGVTFIALIVSLIALVKG